MGAGLIGDDVDRGGAREAAAQQLGEPLGGVADEAARPRLSRRARRHRTREGSVEVVGVLVEVAVRDPALQT